MDDKRQNNPRRLQAGCSTSKTSIENTGYHQPNRVLDADKNHSGLGELNSEKLPTSPGPVFYDGPHSKDTNDAKYIDQANFNKACKMNSEKNQEDASLGTRLEHHNSRTQDNVKPENDTTFTKTSDSEKEEGHYEELVCLVRQFYVERPVNPAAIAYQNIETC